MRKTISCKWHYQVFSFCSQLHAAVCTGTATVRALHCTSLAVCNKAICHVRRDLLRWNLKYLLKTTGLITISVSPQQAPNIQRKIDDCVHFMETPYFGPCTRTLPHNTGKMSRRWAQHHLQCGTVRSTKLRYRYKCSWQLLGNCC